MLIENVSSFARSLCKLSYLYWPSIKTFPVLPLSAVFLVLFFSLYTLHITFWSRYAYCATAACIARSIQICWEHFVRRSLQPRFLQCSTALWLNETNFCPYLQTFRRAIPRQFSDTNNSWFVEDVHFQVIPLSTCEPFKRSTHFIQTVPQP